MLYVARDDTIVGAVALEDEIRPESRQAVAQLHALGVRVVMITGDAQQVADHVAAQLGIDEVFAEVLPADKEHAVVELQARGLQVAMVGDGVNDAPALARADVGIAIGAGTDVAIESAGVVLASSDPRLVVSVIRLSQASYKKMVQNLVWATGYNVIAIPLAAGAFAWAGITLAPAVGGILMSVSTVVVALNAQTLRRLDLRPQAEPAVVATSADSPAALTAVTADVTTRDASRLPVVRVHTFEVGKDDVTVERMPMLHPRVLDDRVRDRILVVAGEVAAAPRAGLLVGHER